jgi:hypothetical protein
MNRDNHLPVLLSPGTWEPGLPFVDICDTELPVEQLGRAIIVNYEAGLAAENEAITRLVTAGMLLLEAKSRDLNFEDFLRDHCNGLSHSWAYDLIAIARGKIDEVRAKAKARKNRHREKQAAAGAKVRARSGTDSSQEALLAQLKKTFAKMNDETRKQALSYVLCWSSGCNSIVDLSPSVQ